MLPKSNANNNVDTQKRIIIENLLNTGAKG
jgi:hypothetical protein